MNQYKPDVEGERSLTTNGQTRDRLPRLYSGSIAPSISTFSGGRTSSSFASRRAAAVNDGSDCRASAWCENPVKELTGSTLPPGKLFRSANEQRYWVRGGASPHLTSPACILIFLARTSSRIQGSWSKFMSGMRMADSEGVFDHMTE